MEFAKPAQKRNDFFSTENHMVIKGMLETYILEIDGENPVFSKYIGVSKKNFIYDIAIGFLIEATWILKHLFISGCFNWTMNQFFTIGNAWKSPNIQF